MEQVKIASKKSGKINDDKGNHFKWSRVKYGKYTIIKLSEFSYNSGFHEFSEYEGFVGSVINIPVYMEKLIEEPVDLIEVEYMRSGIFTYFVVVNILRDERRW